MKQILLITLIFNYFFINTSCNNHKKDLSKKIISKTSTQRKEKTPAIVPTKEELRDTLSFVFLYNKKENIIRVPKYYIDIASYKSGEFSRLGYLHGTVLENIKTNFKNVAYDTVVVIAMLYCGINVFVNDTSQKKIIINKNFCTIQNRFWFEYPLACYSYFVDINKDGYKDWLISNQEMSSKGNPWFDAYIYVPKTKRFKVNKNFFRGYAFFGGSNHAKYFVIGSNNTASEGIQHNCILVGDSLQIVYTKQRFSEKGKGGEVRTILTKIVGKKKIVLYDGDDYKFEEWAKKNNYEE